VNNWQRIRLLWVFILTCALSASANNPPQPDGVFSVILIFPVVFIGVRLVATASEPATKTRRILIGLALASCFILTLAGTGIGALGLLGILVYGVVRGVQIMRRGQGWKAYLTGTMVILWVSFAVADYLVSIASIRPSVALNESLAVTRLRMLSDAEINFANTGSGSATTEPKYATVAGLLKAGLINDGFQNGQARNGYRFGQMVEPPMQQFLFYALPAEAPRQEPAWWLLPGSSLLLALRDSMGHQVTGIRSFAVDETGVIRYSTHSVASPVTREEVLHWKRLE
jgi:hypothetical protein